MKEFNGIQLDPFQQKAIEKLEKGHSLIISAPTGAGKTLIAEYIIHSSIEQGKGVIYTSPVKALSNQKYRDFKRSFGIDRVGILTGDVSINPDAPLLIMTTEIFRNALFENKAIISDKDWLIFDEIHFIDDIERGTVWEESIMLMPEHMKLLCLSATIPNLHEIADWINKIHKTPISVIEEKKRPVPLHHMFFADDKIFASFSELAKKVYKTDIRRKRRQRRNIKKIFYDIKPCRFSTLAAYLLDKGLLPTIYFAFGRKRTEAIANEAAVHLGSAFEKEQAALKAFDELCRKYNIENNSIAASMRNLVKKGIAYHHAGLIPSLKEIIEQLFTGKLLRFIATTETFALGINMPARSVVFDELSKFYGTYYGRLKTRDYYQMAGRAGRRGFDKEGIAISKVNPRHIPLGEVRDIIYGQTEAVFSQFNLSYSSILNLYQRLGERLVNLYPMSLAYHQSRPVEHKKDINLLKAKISLLKDMGYLEDGRLSLKGENAAKIFGYELQITELLETGIFTQVNYIDLAAILCAIIFEPRKGQARPNILAHIKPIKKTVDRAIKNIKRREQRFQIHPLTKSAHFHLTSTLQAWMKGKDFEEACAETDIDYGEIVRYFRMTIQLLRQLKKIEGIPKQITAAADRAIEAINRDEIDAERQLAI